MDGTHLETRTGGSGTVQYGYCSIIKFLRGYTAVMQTALNMSCVFDILYIPSWCVRRSCWTHKNLGNATVLGSVPRALYSEAHKVRFSSKHRDKPHREDDRKRG